MTSGTHVAIDGYLYKVSVKGFYELSACRVDRFLGYGRLVRPCGSYSGCPVVGLYRCLDHNHKAYYAAA